MVADDRGQISPIVAVLAALAMFAALGFAAIGQVWAERVHATAAADAVALAAAIDPAEGEALAAHYRSRGARVEVGDGSARVFYERGHAESRARAQVGDVAVSPALVAVVARASQLAGVTVTPLAWERDRVLLTASDASALASIAPELGLCLQTQTPSTTALTLC